MGNAVLRVLGMMDERKPIPNLNHLEIMPELNHNNSELIPKLDLNHFKKLEQLLNLTFEKHG